MRRYLMTTPTDKDDKGVFAISLVEKPAMESEWVALKDEPINLKAINDKEQMLLGVALIPNKPVYRNDEQNGEYLIEFSADAIKETAHKFIKTGNQNNATVNHKVKLGEDVVNVVESWIIEDDKKDKTRLHGINEPVGSWVVKMKVNDPKLYQMASEGKLKGISIEGLFDKELVNLNSTNMSKSISDEIKEGFADVLKMFKQDKPKEGEVKLGTATLEDGETEVSFEGDELVAGITATVNGEPIPEGTHTTNDGKVIVVEEAGTIASVNDAESEDGEDVDAEKEQIKQAIAEAVMNLGKEFKAELKSIKEENTELKSKVEKLSKQDNKSVKKQINNQPKAELDTNGEVLGLIRSK